MHIKEAEEFLFIKKNDAWGLDSTQFSLATAFEGSLILVMIECPCKQ
jgi:hypothetical protein